MKHTVFAALRIAVVVALIAAVVIVIASCGGSNADTVNKNITTECDQFHCLRKIVLINGITDKTEFEVTGLCSIERDQDVVKALCKEPGPNGKPVFKRHYLGLSDNTIWTNVQLESLQVSQYRTKIVIRPTSIVPDLDLATGDSG